MCTIKSLYESCYFRSEILEAADLVWISLIKLKISFFAGIQADNFSNDQVVIPQDHSGNKKHNVNSSDGFTSLGTE